MSTSRKGKRVAGVTVAVGLVVLGMAGYALRVYAIEEYWLWRLRSTDSEWERVKIVGKLGSLGSVRAIPEVLRAYDKLSPIRGAGYLAPGSMQTALVQIGEPALPSLLSAMVYDTGASRRMIPKAIARILRHHHPAMARRVGHMVNAGNSLDEAVLEVLSEGTEVSAHVRKAAAESLKNLRNINALPR